MRIKKIGQIILLCCLAILSAPSAGAGILHVEIGNEDPGMLKGIGSALFYDDEYPSDGHLTMAGRVEYGLEEAPSWAGALVTRIPLINSNKLRTGYFLEQGAYTPSGDNKSISTVVLDDRPYAGYLKIGSRLAAIKNFDDMQTIDTMDLTTGMIGPASLASRVQEKAHSSSGSETLAGWDNQLSNEPIINIDFQRQYRFVQTVVPGFMLELSPHLAAALGNMLTYAGTGIMARVGSGLDRDYGGPRQGLQLSGLSFYDAGRGWQWNIFAGLEAKVVLRNIFLDGNTFSPSHSVEKELFVIDTVFGGAVTYKSMRATISLLERSEEFKLQQGHDSLVKFAVSVGF